MGNMYIWGGLAIAAAAGVALAIYLYKSLWSKAEDLGAAEAQVEGTEDAREVERAMAQAQANRKTAKEYVDWAKKQGEGKE